LSIFTYRISREDKAIGSIRLSYRLAVRLFSLYLLNRLTFELEILCLYYDHGSPGIESQGQVKVKGQCQSW